MKKLLGIVVLSLLLSGNAYAGCLGDIEWSTSKSGTTVYVEVLNNANKQINIDEIRLLTSDGQIIKQVYPYPKILQPFGRENFWFSVKKLNTKVWKSTLKICKYTL